MVQNPQPWFAVFLVLCWPPILLASIAVMRRVTSDRGLAAVAAPGVAVSMWLLAVHVASTALQSYTQGVWAGTLLAGGAAAAVAGRWWRRERIRIGDLDPRLSRWCWITAVLATALLAPAACRWAFHDEHLVTGHLAMITKIQNGAYPPRHGTFPTSPLRYHYAFDLFAALLTTLCRLRADRAIDVTSLAAWFYTWCLLWSWGERNIGRNAGLWTSSLTLFGGGVAMFMPASEPSSRVDRLLSWIPAGGAMANPPLASYFLQHPWAIGLPIALCILLLWSDRTMPRSWPRIAVLAVLFLLLSLAHIVLFALVLGAVVAAEVVLHARRAPRRVIAVFGLALGVLVLARALGGFFSDQPTATGSLIRFAPHGITGNLSGNGSWNLASLGLLLGLGILGLAALPIEPRLVLGGMAGVGLLVTNLCRYAYTWDIVKFATVSSFALGIASSAAAWRFLVARPTPLGRTVGLAAVLLAILPGVAFLGVFATDMSGVPHQFVKSPARLTANDARAIDWLRRHVSSRDIVFRNLSASAAYAQWGGLAQPYVDPGTQGFGFPDSMIAHRNRILADLPEDAAAYRAEGIRWFVLDDNDAQLRRAAEVWQRQGQARIAATFGGLCIVEIH